MQSSRGESAQGQAGSQASASFIKHMHMRTCACYIMHVWMHKHMRFFTNAKMCNASALISLSTLLFTS